MGNDASPPEGSPPTALARLWRDAHHDDPAPRVGLSRSGIVQAAIELADADGLDAVSMARVAQRLGFATMSLYRHVTSKDELLLLMHDTACRPPEDGSDPVEDRKPVADGDWRSGLTQWCRSQRVVLRRHPWLEGIRLSERVGTPSQLAWLDSGLRILAGTPLTERDKTETLLMLSGHIFWEARVHGETAHLTQSLDRHDGPPAEVLGVMIRGLVDGDRFPALRRAVDAGAFDAATVDDPGDSPAEIDFGLQRILDGIERLISDRADT